MTEIKTYNSSGATLKVKQYKYNPQPDITIYELALFLPIFSMSMGVNVTKFIDDLPDEARRHFEELIDNV